MFLARWPCGMARKSTGCVLQDRRALTFLRAFQPVAVLQTLQGFWTDDQIFAAIENFFPRYQNNGLKVQTSLGASIDFSYNDNDGITLGAEYFYNQLGYSSPEAYIGLFLPRATPLNEPAQPFISAVTTPPCLRWPRPRFPGTGQPSPCPPSAIFRTSHFCRALTIT